MNIFEYLKHPHPWFNTEAYHPWQIAMFLIGTLLWLVSYIDIITNIRKKQQLAIPYGTVLTNYGWEISAAIFFVPDMGKALVLGYWLWMIFDTYIFASTFKYAFKQSLIPQIRDHIKWYLIAGILVSFSTQVTFMVRYDLPMAPISANIINVYMSIAFIYLLYIPGQLNTKLTAWTKFLGTAIINIMFFTKYPGNWHLVTLAVSCAVFDILYIVLLNKKSTNSN
jgi:hypothetical protein